MRTSHLDLAASQETSTRSARMYSSQFRLRLARRGGRAGRLTGHCMPARPASELHSLRCGAGYGFQGTGIGQDVYLPMRWISFSTTASLQPLCFAGGWLSWVHQRGTCPGIWRRDCHPIFPLEASPMTTTQQLTTAQQYSVKRATDRVDMR